MQRQKERGKKGGGGGVYLPSKEADRRTFPSDGLQKAHSQTLKRRKYTKQHMQMVTRRCVKTKENLLPEVKPKSQTSRTVCVQGLVQGAKSWMQGYLCGGERKTVHLQ